MRLRERGFLVYSKRRPYLNLDASQPEFFRESVRFLKDITDKESAFEKPYLDLDYRLMHFDFPFPDWKWPAFGGDWPDGYPPPCRPCFLYINTPAFQDCKNPIKIGPAVVCTNDPWTSKDCSVRVFAELGELKEVVLGDGPGFATLYRDAYVNETIMQHVICAEITQVDGTTCMECVDVECCSCADASALTFDDDSTPDTCTPGSSVVIYVTGGCGPFLWTTDATGWTLSNSTTDENTRTNGLACASGT
jgi:hypothetical protein